MIQKSYYLMKDPVFKENICSGAIEISDKAKIYYAKTCDFLMDEKVKINSQNGGIAIYTY